MEKSWQELKKELEEETRKIFLTCPDEIKRYHYGIITHSDAGKYSFEQYFGHWVHAYAGYYSYTGLIGNIMNLAMDSGFELAQVKKIFEAVIMSSSPVFGEYGGQKLQAKYSAKVVEAWDSVQTKEELVELLKAFHAFISRLYWWFHWYFPWGIGSSLCHRLSPEDIKEIARLSQTS